MGAADSIADIVGAAVGWDLLGVDRIVASPVPTGMGKDQDRPRRVQHSRPRHGRVAARHSAGRIGDPRRADHAHRRRHSGHAGRFVRPAAGHEDRADRLRGRAEGFCRAAEYSAAPGGRSGRSRGSVLARTRDATVCVLETNLDDISGEMVGYCTSRLWDAGALDVFTTAIQMKKNRPGVKLTVLCRPADAAAMEGHPLQRDDHVGRPPLDGLARRCSAASRTVSTRRGGRSRARSAGFATARRVSPPSSSPAAGSPRSEHVPLREVYEAAQKAFDLVSAARVGE